MKQIFLIIIGANLLLHAGFSRDSSGVVSDSTTGLVWQDDYSDNGDTVKEANWEDAIGYCEALTLGGSDNWKLPNKKELLSIVDYTVFNPAISSVFQNTDFSLLSNIYWSSTTDANGISDAWGVYFHDGYATGISESDGNSGKLDNGNVRCVRAGQ